jgi:glycosyltransferase involved in cell wall biosynthesis
MRLAFCVRAIYPQHGYGGLERAATAQVRHLLAQGVDVALYTQPLGEPFQVGTMDDGRRTMDENTPHSSLAGTLNVKPVDYGRLPLRANGIAARLTNYRVFVDEMGRRVRIAALRGRLEGAYAHGLCAWGVRDAREWGLPVVANPHGLEEFKVSDPLKRLAYAPFRAWVRAGCRAADRVVATDRGMRDEVARLLGVDAARVVVIPSGVDVEEGLEYVSEEEQAQIVERWPYLEPRRSKFVGISVGRLEANKGFGDLIEALAQIAPEMGDSWAWVLVGEGTLREGLQGQAASLGLGDRVIFTGAVSDSTLHNLYARADVFAHPSLFEGSSLVTLEAMGHGLPVVASRVGGIPDKVVEGETGFLVGSGDARELGARVLMLARDPGLREVMGRRGAARVKSEFNWARSVERLVEVFGEIQEEKVACRDPYTEGRTPC